MPIIYGDISEPPKLHEQFRKRIGDQYQIKHLGFFDCNHNYIHLYKERVKYCANTAEVPYLLKSGFKIDNERLLCDSRGCMDLSYIRVADYTNDRGSFYIERCSVGDFVGKMKDRLYIQMNKMDQFIKGNKIIILEGTDRDGITTKLQDSSSYFGSVDKKYHDLSKLSPLEQAIEITGRPEWVWSFVREAFMRDMMFIQTWDYIETVEFIIQADEGFGKESKHRLIPKKYPHLSIEQSILAQFKGIGEKRSKAIMDTDDYVIKKIKLLTNYMKKKYKVKL